MKIRTVLIHTFLSLVISSSLFSQKIDEIKSFPEDTDTLSTEIIIMAPLLFMNQFENYSNESSFHFLDDFQFLRQNEVILGLEFGRYLLENRYPNPFGDNFRPRTASEYNYAIERFRIEGEIPIRRTGWSNFKFRLD